MASFHVSSFHVFTLKLSRRRVLCAQNVFLSQTMLVRPHLGVTVMGQVTTSCLTCWNRGLCIKVWMSRRAFEQGSFFGGNADKQALETSSTPWKQIERRPFLPLTPIEIQATLPNWSQFPDLPSGCVCPSQPFLILQPFTIISLCLRMQFCALRSSSIL